MATCRIHNVGFYHPEPRAIYCMALQSSNNKLAVSRSDAAIEIWNINHAMFIERTITPSLENFSIEGLAWCDSRLFSVGLHGLLIEYNIYTLDIKSRSAVTGEAAFCLDINKNKTHIAIGTEQGYLNIFKINEDGVSFEKFLDKQEGRIICLKFDPTGKFVVSGNIDAIRIWNVETGHATHKMTTGRSEANKPTVVWCLEVTADFLVISGDSRGRLTFWDGKVGGMLESYQSHKADVLAVCLSEDQKQLYCAGVDATITNYVNISAEGGRQKWVKSIQRRIHEHDVRALTLCGQKLYSGGMDGYLACSFHPPKTLIKMPPIMQNPVAQTTRKGNYLLLRYHKHLEVWSLGRTVQTTANYRGFVPLKNHPKKLVVLQRIAKDWDGVDNKEGVRCGCMSPDGRWLFMSTCQGSKLFQMHLEEEKPTLERIEDLEKKKPCSQAVFTPDSSHLIMAPASGNLLVYELKNNSMVQMIECKKEITDTITFLLVSDCGQYLVAGDPASNVAIWNYKNDTWRPYCKLPRYAVAAPTALNVHPKTLNLVVAYADNKIIEYDIRKRQLTNFSRDLDRNTSAEWKSSRLYPIQNVAFHPRCDNVILLHDDAGIIKVDKKTKIPKTSAKVPKISEDLENGNQNNTSGEDRFYSVVKKYKHLVHLSGMSDDELLVVEVNPLALIEQLPPALTQTTFGTK